MTADTVGFLHFNFQVDLAPNFEQIVHQIGSLLFLPHLDDGIQFQIQMRVKIFLAIDHKVGLRGLLVVFHGQLFGALPECGVRLLVEAILMLNELDVHVGLFHEVHYFCERSL